MGPETPHHEVVLTDDGSLTVRHPGHGECYHSQAGAAAEARELYVTASGIRAAFARTGTVAVLDVGLGLGYNAVATILAWHEAPAGASLEIASLEIDPELPRALSSGVAPWQATWSKSALAACAALRPTDDGRWIAELTHPSGSTCHWTIYVADAAKTPVPRPLNAAAWGYVWQDPFSPEKNPPLWGEAWFRRVAAVAAPEAVLMTYSVARAVRDALAASGWEWEKIGTPWRAKRHWLKARPVAAHP